MNNKVHIRALTYNEFIKEFRPDGKGHIKYIDENGKVESDIEFDEVLCDCCNIELKEEDTIYVFSNYAYCKTCIEQI